MATDQARIPVLLLLLQHSDGMQCSLQVTEQIQYDLECGVLA